MKKENNNRREFLKKVTLAGAGLALISKSFGKENNFESELGIPEDNMFTLPALPYAYDALEPFIDKQTMELHHTKHHQSYVDKLNKGLTSFSSLPATLTIEDLCKNISQYNMISIQDKGHPSNLFVIRNNGGGHYNHSMFWKLMKPNGGSVLSPTSSNEPFGKIADAIKSTFDSFTNFKTKFSETAMKVFGSGWAWMVINKDGKLEICSTPNQDNPLMDVSELKGNPVLGLDVWEHAYYLKYQNKRADYVSNWWNIVNWEEAEKRMP